VITVKVSTSNPEVKSLLLRQTPGCSGLWKGVRFIVDEHIDKCDWWVVCHRTGLKNKQSLICDPDHLAYISMEPFESNYKFIKQFTYKILCDKYVTDKTIKYFNGITWWVGMNVTNAKGYYFSNNYTLDYDTLSSMHVPEKKTRISVVCSRNTYLPGHRKRLEFIDRLMRHPMSKHIDYFGGGNKPVADKWDAIAPYKYHLVLENSVVEDYWTEKIGDAYIGFSYPIYYGCPNILEYFSGESLQVIDIDNFDESVAVLERIIKEDPYQDRLDAIIQARRKVLNDYNIFNIMADICDKPAARYKKCMLKPLSCYQRSLPRRLARKVIYSIKGIKD